MIFKLFLLTLSFTNLTLFWVIKIPHVLALVLFAKNKLWKSEVPYEVFFLCAAMAFMTVSTVINPSVQFFSDLIGLSICGFLYIVSFGLAKKSFSQPVISKYVFNSVYYCSMIALGFYVIEFYLSFDIRGSLGLKREIKAEYFGVLRNYGLSTEPGGFAYYYLSLLGFIAFYVVNNRSVSILAKVLVISGSFLLTFSAGAVGVLFVALFITIIYSVGSSSVAKSIILGFCFFGGVWVVYQNIPNELLAPIVGKLSLSTDYASSANRLNAYLFGLSRLTIDMPFGHGADYINGYFDHSLFNWFLTYAVQYGYLVLFCIGCFFVSIFLRIKKMPAEIQIFHIFAVVAIIGILNIVGVYHSVVYWFVLGAIGGLGARRYV